MFALAKHSDTQPRVWPLLLALSALLSLIYSAIIPPFQSPDETTHLERAYLLSRGHILLTSINGSASGGYIDEGLERYMDQFLPLKGSAAKKITQAELASAQSIQWAHREVFRTPVVAAYYLPLSYLPHACGLLLGQTLHLSVNQSYRLARLFALLCSTACIALACAIWPPSAAALAVLCLPMNVFLSATAVLDPMTTALTCVALATFLKMANTGASASYWLYPLHVISVCLVSGCRAHMLPLLILPFIACFFLAKPRYLIAAFLSLISIFAWTLFTIKTTVYPPGEVHPDHAMRLVYFLTHPIALYHMISATLTDPGHLDFYYTTFIGNLGWLDTPLPSSLYFCVSVAVILSIVLSTSLGPTAEQRIAAATLLVISLSAVFLVFLALLVQWTSEHATTIDGVQGRYFTIPCLCLVYALTMSAPAKAPIRFALSHGILLIMLFSSGYTTTKTLLLRYHTVVTANQPAAPSIRLADSCSYPLPPLFA